MQIMCMLWHTWDCFSFLPERSGRSDLTEVKGRCPSRPFFLTPCSSTTCSLCCLETRLGPVTSVVSQPPWCLVVPVSCRYLGPAAPGPLLPWQCPPFELQLVLLAGAAFVSWAPAGGGCKRAEPSRNCLGTIDSLATCGNHKRGWSLDGFGWSFLSE